MPLGERRDGEQVEDYLGRGLRLEDQGSFVEALALYRRAQEIFRDDPRPVHRAGVMLIRLDRRDEARAAFEAAAEVQRDYAPALTNLGNMALEQNDIEGAIQLYRRAIAASPDYPGAHHNLGVAYRRQGRMADYVAEQRQATRLERNYSREMDRLRLRGGAGGALGKGCGARTAAILLILSAGAIVAAHARI
jgi:Flp pilus assembly protein TadD